MVGDESLPDWLRRQIARREWNQADFARRLDLSTSVVSRWFTGNRVPDPAYCDRIADVLGVDVDLVLTLAGHRPPDPKVRSDDPGEEIAAMARRVDWSKPGRVDTFRVMLRLYLDQDREEKGKG